VDTQVNPAAYAGEVLDALATGRFIANFTSRDPGFGMPQAYAVAEALHRARLARGERVAGRKIGFTNRSLWPLYGVDAPIWGHVYDTTLVQAAGGRAEIPVGPLPEPRIEPEIVLHLGVAPPVTDDPAAILACVDWIAQGFEIVPSPFRDWKFKAADTIAANGLHGTLVVGTPVPVAAIADCARKLRELRLTLMKNGAPHAEGTGANALGSPLLAFAHFAGVLARLPQFAPVAAGEVVTTGTLTDAYAVQAGDVWSARLAGIELPGLELAFR
jgi:2-oxo-3-hexenedioate decarboxylase